MRFYLVSFEQAGEKTRLGTTSAAEAVRAIHSMRCDGWRTMLIKRGTEVIDIDELKADAEQESHVAAAY